MQESPDPLTAVTVVVRRDQRFLLGFRAADQEWGFPGGRREPGESDEAAGRRELAEETGLQVGAMRQLPFESSHLVRGQLWVVLFMVADWAGGEPSRLEPDKCLEWRWCTAQAPPAPLFHGAQRLLASGTPIFS